MFYSLKTGVQRNLSYQNGYKLQNVKISIIYFSLHILFNYNWIIVFALFMQIECKLI